MAKVGLEAIYWHEGEEKMQSLLHVPPIDNPTKPGLSAHAQRLLHSSSLLALGALDEQGRPWTTLFGGEPGFARSLGQSVVGVKALGAPWYDPMLNTLLRPGRKSDEVAKEWPPKDFSALGIHLATRDRVKLFGKIVVGGIVGGELEDKNPQNAAAEVQMVLAVQGSLGNCPKYLNKKEILAATPKPIILSETLPLTEPALNLLAKADMFFITSHHHSHMSTNYRGGPPGFIRIEKNDASGVLLVYPEYSGNRFYQTLGNLYLDPRAGLVVPDFDTGNVLYMTGATEILFGRDAAATLPRSSLAVQIRIDAVRFLQNTLPFRGKPGERSPYNPPMRYLATEHTASTPQHSHPTPTSATLLKREIVTPTVARFRFDISPFPTTLWEPGQHVALSFASELSGGYAHMADSDPQSLNDDYIRTFTVSSPPLPHNSFEITIRNVGTVTNFLFRYNIRAGLEIPLLGFGGRFAVKQPMKSGIVPFVAGGVGITPLLAQLHVLDLARLRLFWMINIRDINFVVRTLEDHTALAPSTAVFVSGITESTDDKDLARVIYIENLGAKVTRRRILEEDIKAAQEGLGDAWYICTGTALRTKLVEWLEGKEVIYEDFNY